jgi:hypothetical protein
MTTILETDLETFTKFIRERSNSGMPLESLEESLAEFRAWQSELARFRTGLEQSLRQAAAGEAKPLDIEAVKARMLDRARRTLENK